ncbi:hypothetical protein EXW58_29255 (plasmid) [Bacillus mycoides]|uniref:hypothetical protein n=1 Tax=Bacillus mycoides TaxID=1405 RepID=UPI001C01C285|nr:hypothetical protein [Bacillus mycoides]QWG31469.1 hypothetical protein EXW58_29255 [Bacillus mycoides]
MKDIDIATEVFIFQWGCSEASLEDIRNKIVDLGIAEKEVVLRKDLEEMQYLFHLFAGFYDINRLRVKKGTSEGQVESKEDYTGSDTPGMSIATEAKILIWNNFKPPMEELRNKIVDLNIANEQVVLKKSRVEMEDLLYTLCLFSDHKPSVGRNNISAKEIKREKKLLERIKKKGPIKLKGVTYISKNISN